MSVPTQPNEEYKGYIVSENKERGIGYIYSSDHLLMGMVQADEGKDNAIEKAKARIDSGKINNVT